MRTVASRGLNTHGFNDASVKERENALLNGVYRWMSLGLFVTAIAAYYAAQSFLVLLRPGSLILLMLVEVGLVVYLTARIDKISAQTATLVFLAYSALNGVTLSPLAYIYSGESIASTFFICAAMFVSMSFYGTITKRDLSGLGGFCTMGLFGLVAASIVNLFMQSAQVSFVMSVCGVIVFLGLTAWDVNKIKASAAYVDQESPEFHQVQTLGALTLYMDFINLFIFLLRLLGRRD